VKALTVVATITGTLLLIPGTVGAQEVRDSAAAVVPRLAPSAFPELPGRVRADLASRRYRIPQTYGAGDVHNVINGEFIQPGENDWAVLCSRDDTSRILVFRRGRPDHVDELAARADRIYMQGIGNGKVGFSRMLTVADSAYIHTHASRYGCGFPPQLNHAGINDISLEKASEVWYWYGGRWWQSQGAN
jgi:hypothetical protein